MKKRYTTSQHCSDDKVNTNFDPAIELEAIKAATTLEEAKTIFLERFMKPMQNGAVSTKKEKLAKFQFIVETAKTKERVIEFAYNISLSGMGLGTGIFHHSR